MESDIGGRNEMTTTTYILITLVAIFLVVGFFLPYVQAEFGEQSNTAGFDKFNDDLADAAAKESVISGFDIILSILKMFTWSFGSFPFWMDAILLIPRSAIVISFIMVVRGI